MEPRLTLEPLDPTGDGARWEGLIGRILAEAAPALERRARPAGPLLSLADLLRPALGVAFVATALSGLVLARETESRPSLLSGVPEELGLPAPVAEWLAEGREPTTEDLLASLEREIP